MLCIELDDIKLDVVAECMMAEDVVEDDDCYIFRRPSKTQHTTKQPSVHTAVANWQ